MTIHPSHQPEARRALWSVGLVGLTLVLFAWSPWSQPIGGSLPVHMALETVAIVVAGLLFAVVWSTPRHESDFNAWVLSGGFLGVAALDFTHMLLTTGAAQGVPPGDAGRAMLLWLGARSLGAASLLAVAIRPWGTPIAGRPVYWLLAGLGLLALATPVLLLLEAPPRAPTPAMGSGLTPIERSALFGPIAVYLLAAGLFWRRLREPRTFSASWLLAAAGTLAASETYCTLIAGHGIAHDLIDHLLKVAAYLFLYRALFVELVHLPYQRLAASEDQLRTTLDTLPDLLFEIDEDGRYLEVHANRVEALVAPASQLLGKTLSEVMPPAAAQSCLAAIQEARQTGRSHGRRVLLDVPDGHRCFELSVARKPAQADAAPRYVVLSRDITERMRVETQLRQLSQAVTQSPYPIMITDLQGRIEYINPAFTSASGYTEAEALGRNPRLLKSGRTPRATYREMWRCLAQGRPWQGEFINRRKNGKEFIELARIYPMRNAAGEITHYLSHKEDITAKRAAAERIQRLSNYDQLTGLPNRMLLQERFQYSMGLVRRAEGTLTLLWLDLDNFKDINETIGHSTGDLLLREVALRLQSVLRGQDILSRHSGGDFVLVLPGTDQLGAARIATDLLQALSRPLHLGQQALIVTASIGVAVYPGDGDTLETLLRSAEAAMYRAKGEGRNGYRFFAPAMQERSARALALGQALKLALARGELRLVYQPQVALPDGRLVGAEALLRWQHPQWGAVGPAEFVPIAEGSGLITQIGEWVLRTALNQLREWQGLGLPVVKLAVNLSAMQLALPGFPAMVAALVRETGVAPGLLELELTEATAMNDPEAAIATLEVLSRLGLRLSIDDFGTGYSSLSYLKRLTVYKLKIDQSFVRDLHRDPDDQAIVTAIIQMAHSLGLITMAEGVETPEQLAFLKAQSCDEIQGYYFHRPLESPAFADLLRSQM